MIGIIPMRLTGIVGTVIIQKIPNDMIGIDVMKTSHFGITLNMASE